MSRYYYQPRRHSNRSSGPLIAFLLIASFGILFAGCSGGNTPTQQTEEYTFTEEDVVRVEELKDIAQGELPSTGSGEYVPYLALNGSGQVNAPASNPPSPLNLSNVSAYDRLRISSMGTESTVYRVTNDFLNVRQQPSVTAPLVERMEKGGTLHVISFMNAAWAHVRLFDEREGYVSSRYIAKVVSEKEFAAEKEKYSGKYFVDFGFLNVRSEPDTASDKMGELPGQMIVEPLSMDDVWARILYEGNEGYVAQEYLSPFMPNLLVRQDQYALPILTYDLGQDGVASALQTHIGALKSDGYSFLTFTDFYEFLLIQEERDTRLDPKTVIIALENGAQDSVTDVTQILRNSAVKAVFFVQTDTVGPGGIPASMITTMVANGFDVQAAGHMGDDLRSLTNPQVELELSQGRQILEAAGNHTVLTVSYPLGGVNERVMSKAAAAGYLFGVSAAEDTTFSRDMLLSLPRVTVNATQTPEGLLQSLSDQ